MEEKNELNDIILNKSGSGSSTKKLLLAIAALTLILIIVLVIMNSLKSESDEQAPNAAVVPEPSSPTEVIDDPLFEPVEVIQEGGNESATQDLGQIAQKIKQESFQTAPATATNTQPVMPAIPQQNAPVAQVKPTPTAINVPKVQTQPVAAKVIPAAPAKVQVAPKTTATVVNTPTIKSTKPTESKPVATASKPATTPTKTAPVTRTITTTATPAAKKPVEKSVDTTGTYYIQVGSFAKEPNKALFERLNASGLKYVTSPNGSMTKVMVGPFQGEKAARDVLGTVKRNIESNAYITKG
ncbi:SPOR domain-containing protein [Sulfuricurvum sp.]|uniref:SPOR domain-containing protein n=1 Tax=Sulfuricurvum sp. TaxID=2025608 RepID=UPI00261ABFFC|nr:SPOR domain-containing protein [Sulfuricurvum sp.]MDD2781163.1 SPOR domain-containing protein [Sulfuricurvum sp.]